MKRFLPTIGTAALAANLFAQTNFVFVTIDDLSRESLGIHGCTITNISPNLDALAQEGLRFEHCHVQSGNCTPSRNIMSSGQYQQHNRVFSLGKEGAGNHLTQPALPDVFRAAGYHTGLMGKNSHMSPFDPYSGFDVEYDGYGSTRDPQNVYDKLTDAFAAASSQGKPLYFNLNIFDPHTGWYGWDHKDGVTITETDNHPSTIYTEHDVPYPAWFPPMSENERTLPSKDDPVTQTNSMMVEVAAYYNTVKRADDSIGKMMQAIDDAGQTSNTIIVVVSDHGVQLPGGKTQLYDHSSRSPLFVKWPGVTSSNTVNNTEMIASFDLLPTFCEMIGQPIPVGVDGRSFAPIVKGEINPEWRDYVYKQQNDRNKMRAIQTTELLYIYNPWSNGSDTVGSVATGMHSWRALRSATNAAAVAYADFFEYRTVEELYDITNDPHCLTNLFSSPAYAADLADLQDLMLQEMIVSGDDLVINAFTNRTDPAANAQLVDDQAAFQNAQANDPNYVRDVFYNPHDDWKLIGHTLFEPAGEWDIWTPETTGINLNTSNGDNESGDNCIEFNGSAADVSRLIVSNALDTSVLDLLKLESIFIDGGAFSGGATLKIQYNDGSGWNTFQTISSAGEKNLTFDLTSIGSPDAIQFGIQADLNGTGGSIYMDHTRLTAWQDWTPAPTSTTFNATNAGTVRVTFEFETQNFTDSDKLLLEWFDGSAWTLLEDYDFSYVLLTNKTYSDVIDMHDTEFTFPADLEFRFRSESTDSGQAFSISNLSIETREAMREIELTLPPTANPDSYSETAPKAITVPSPGILDNDVPGSGGTLSASLVSDVSHGILELNADGSFVYAATNGYTGHDSFTYSAVNNAGASTATVSLAISAPPTSQTHTLSVTFGAAEDLASTLNGNSTTASTTQGGTISAPAITINGLDIDGTGGTDDQVEIGFSVNATGGSVDRLSAGYRLDPGYTLTMDITSVSVTLGSGATNYSISEIGFISTKGNNAARTYTITSPDSGFTTLTDVSSTQSLTQDPGIDGLSAFTMISTEDGSNGNRARNFVAEFSISGNAPSSVITNFADWASVHGLSTDAGYTLDYAFNINPHLSERYTLPASGNNGLPHWEFSGSENRLVVEYIRRIQADDLTYKAQFTDCLTTNWTDAVSSETTTPVDTGFERVSVSDHITTSEASNRFGRIIVQKE
ncbi:Arylsulfatase [Pontiella desulfatans]|uniref:Arylsulfatase n=1 Tax=Pontiella desulfatans TaxID=2750659 RepID=A0A6C2TYA4_PONDE|nr:sulfatase-like hydrolase/transferase [Pontiella desulfatans]SPS73683.1 sulfatase S1_8 [Kiritimatiellales bacterium]VGO12579.1 Arylsulfatase [Pontiella desulfatans]